MGQRHDCIKDVRNIKKIKDYKLNCNIVKLDTSEECNKFSENSFQKATEKHLDLELDDCETYLNQHNVPYFNQEERETPLAFSITAHRDSKHLSQLFAGQGSL